MARWTMTLDRSEAPVKWEASIVWWVPPVTSSCLSSFRCHASTMREAIRYHDEWFFHAAINEAGTLIVNLLSNFSNALTVVVPSSINGIHLAAVSEHISKCAWWNCWHLIKHYSCCSSQVWTTTKHAVVATGVKGLRWKLGKWRKCRTSTKHVAIAVALENRCWQGWSSRQGRAVLEHSIIAGHLKLFYRQFRSCCQRWTSGKHTRIAGHVERLCWNDWRLCQWLAVKEHCSIAIRCKILGRKSRSSL